jgi:hypothetical protein
MSANNEEFGKDLGLMSEVVVTGRKVGMSKTAWAFLAHNETEFSILAPLIEHWAVIKQNNSEVKAVSVEYAEKLIQTVVTIVETDSCGCLHCGDEQKRRHLQYLYVPAVILVRDARERQMIADKIAKGNGYGETVKSTFCRQESEYSRYLHNDLIANGLRKIGIHPAELARYSQFSCDEKGWLTLKCCCSSNDFSRAIRKIVRQRNILASIMTG